MGGRRVRKRSMQGGPHVSACSCRVWPSLAPLPPPQSTFNNAATGIAIDAMAANATSNGTAPSSTDVPSDLPPQPWPMHELMRDPT